MTMLSQRLYLALFMGRIAGKRFPVRQHDEPETWVTRWRERVEFHRQNIMVVMVLLAIPALLMAWHIAILAGCGSLCCISSMGFLAIPFAVALGPVLARERRQGTWDLLRITPFPLEALLVSHTQRGLQQFGGGLRVLHRLIIGKALLVGLGGWIGIVFWFTEAAPSSTGSAFGLFGLMLGWLWFPLCLFEQRQQVMLIMMSALVASAAAPDERKATTWAIVGALVVVGLDLGGGIAVILLRSVSITLEFDLLLMMILGPTAVFMAELSPLGAVGASLLMLAIREGAIVGLWRWAQWSAAQ